MTAEEFSDVSPATLRAWDNTHVWHPFAPMSAFREEQVPIICAANQFDLIDVDGHHYLDGISSLWCNVHGHTVPEIDRAIRDQLEQVAHTTLLGLSSEPSIRLAHALCRITPAGLNKVFYSDSGATSVEVALKIAYQYQQQRADGAQQRTTFLTVDNAYHGDTLGSVSIGSINLFHRIYRDLLFPTIAVPSPVALRIPPGHSRESWLQYCFDEAARLIRSNAH
ncbi:MAG: aminotransferase class III-fold pyridoxal phosphate-dependent enzyme, partial [Planctomycetaceae bacterium]|nr:aminotransferase class III-fold pyridoxal phosphate-dependent enzyme [Planctomycetaceae bacterium]